MKIRNADLADLPGIVEIYNSTVASRQVTADLTPVSVASRAAWFADHRPESHPLWIAEDAQGNMLGWLSFSSFYGRPAYRATSEISIYLAEHVRGQGLGATLLARAIAHAPEIGLKTLLGFIFGHNQPSLRLFEKHGFACWAHLPQVAELDGVERDLLIVGLRV